MQYELDEIIARVNAIPGWFSERQMRFLYPLVSALPSGSILVEIGTYKGRSTLFFVLANEAVNVTTIDNQSKHGELSDEVKKHKVESIIGNSVDVARNFLSKSVAFLFIDGSHEYEDVIADACAWSGTLSPGGLMVFHDYHMTYPGVIKGVTDFLVEPEGEAFDVLEANDGSLALAVIKKRKE